MTTYTYDSINSNNFAQRLRGLVQADGTQRERLQAFLVFSIAHAQEHSNNFTYLDRVMNAARSMTMVRMGDIKGFIAHLVEGIAQKKTKDGSLVYAKRTNKTKVLYRFENLADIPNWWEWSKETRPQPKYDVDKFRAAVKRSMKRLHDEAGITHGQVTDLLGEMIDQSGELFVEWDHESKKSDAA